jgi:hypothetical protein
VEVDMKLMSRSLAVLAVVTCMGCATMQDDEPATAPAERPVGTTGTTPTQPVQVSASEPGVVPVGQLIDVRLQDTLSSGTAKAEQRFEATTVVDLRQGDRALVPAGSVVRGVVASVQPAGKIDRTGQLTLAFDEIVISGEKHEMKALATRVFESGGIREEVGTVGAGAGVGAIVGGILGGLRGALIGAVVGGGGVIAATEGEDIELPAGTIIRLRLDSPLRIR